MDSKLYYQLIRKQRGKLNRFIDELQVGNNCFKGDENILEGWKLHFANLAKQSEPTNFDQEYFSLIDSEYSQIIEICQEVYDHEVVSTEEFEKAIKKLNRNKSADIFGITTECLIYGGEKLEYMLLNIINASLKHCYITNSLKTGTLSPIFKNKANVKVTYYSQKKSVVLPVITSKKVSYEDEKWFMKDKLMPVVNKTAHIGIQRDSRDTTASTIEENLKKARRTLYSLMHQGLHGENGLDPITSVSLLQTFVFPVMFYGLEVLLPNGKNLDSITKQYKKIIKQILSLPVNVADPAIYIISGLLPAEAIIHKKALILFGSICRADCNATEWKIAERQLGLKTFKSNSWFIVLKTIFLKYGIQDPYTSLFDQTITKLKWKHMINQKVNTYWTERIQQDSLMFSSLQYLGGMYRIGKCHPTASTCSANIRDISRIPIRLKILTGSYILQTKRAVFNITNPDPTCMLCGKSDETLSHFLLVCTELENIRMTLIREIIEVCSVLLQNTSSILNLICLQFSSTHIIIVENNGILGILYQTLINCWNLSVDAYATSFMLKDINF
ncbi:unnamed protein product [Mytilus edulis]|uniref:Reverse transcriptase zinc-binding domain-containing protein n=1 Tax=Mytilus edulis TaxID=6550 RepID=A0A8S3QC50_MYTED|nr:unnamed protein product [Mytilus edulis]